MNTSSSSPSPSSSPSSSSSLLLLMTFVLAILAAWLGYAIAHGQSLKDDSVSLATLAFFVILSVLGSRLYSKLLRQQEGS